MNFYLLAFRGGREELGAGSELIPFLNVNAVGGRLMLINPAFHNSIQNKPCPNPPAI
jgi:hypothetical protein